MDMGNTEHDSFITGEELNYNNTGRMSLSAVPNPVECHVGRFLTQRVETRRVAIAKTLREILPIAQEILHEVELQEPRFINTLKLTNEPPRRSYASDDSIGRYDGLRVLSPTHFEVTLFLNQMGVFNFVDDGTLPGGAVLKLSDGRKRSMSLWVEFITASGYLSARKIRARFHSLVGQAVQKCTYRSMVRLYPAHTSGEVRLGIRDRFQLQLTPAFRCNGLWPRSANHWPFKSDQLSLVWPDPQLVGGVKRDGFCLMSQESVNTRDKQASAEGDAWLLDFHQAERRMLSSRLNDGRRQCLGMLKILADCHLNDPSAGGASWITDYDLKTLVLHECEKHPLDDEWLLGVLVDRIIGILLQLISCLQHRRLSHYFLPQVDLFHGRPANVMDTAARRAWCLLRQLLINPKALEQL